MSADFVYKAPPADFVGPPDESQIQFPQICGVRRISYREEGDIDLNGKPSTETEIVGESQSPAWLHGSFETRLQVKSDGKKVLFAGNPGRFGRADNIWNLDLDQSVARANEVLHEHGFPEQVFVPGEELPRFYGQNDASFRPEEEDDKAREVKYTGARVWGIHLTQNYLTGSPANLAAVLNWFSTQSMRRVMRKRRSNTTIEFGAINYCQTQIYDKAAEILAHCKSKTERLFVEGKLKRAEEEQFLRGHTPAFLVVNGEQSNIEKVPTKPMTKAEVAGLYAKRRAWEYAHQNGLLRVEVKCAKDYLVHKGLTYLGAWDMGKVIEIFKERAEIVTRLEVEVDENDVQRLPKALRVAAAAWLAGVDLRTIMPYSTFARKAAALKALGLDVYDKRDLAVVRPMMKEIQMTVATPPDWYQLQAA